MYHSIHSDGSPRGSVIWGLSKSSWAVGIRCCIQYCMQEYDLGLIFYAYL